MTKYLVWIFSICAAVSGIIAYFTCHDRLIVWHVPAAILAYAAFFICVVINIGRALNKPWNFEWALRLCDHGIFYACITIVTGMIWGKLTWGVVWIWEPRLTGMFLMTLIFVSWRLAAKMIARHIVVHRSATSALVILGLPAMGFTHFAAKIMGGIHPTQMPQSGPEAAVSPVAFICAGLCYVAAAWAVSCLKMKKAAVASIEC